MRLSIIILLLLSKELVCSIMSTDEPQSVQVKLIAEDFLGENKKQDTEVLDKILNNPDKIISSDFVIPAGLKNRVLFWAKIYSIYPSSSYVIHDKDDLSIIYKVVNTSDNTKKLSQGGERDNVKKIIEKAYKAKSIKEFYPRSQDEKNIYFIVKRKHKNKNLSAILSGLRTQSGQKDFIVEGIKISSRYLPLMEDIFKEHDLPWELTRIPFVESSFNIRADSKVGARGIWQIMGVTGKKFLGVDSNYDERYSPFKASIVAAKLLEENYKILGTWPLAITAYNHGPGGLRSAVKKLGTKDITKIIDNHKSNTFGFASKNFYSEFLAALYVTVYSDIIFGKIDKQPLMNFFYVEMMEDMKVSNLLGITELSQKDILKYNPELGKKIMNNEMPIKHGSMIKLPPRASYRLEEYFERYLDKKNLEKELRKRDKK